MNKVKTKKITAIDFDEFTSLFMIFQSFNSIEKMYQTPKAVFH